MKASLRMFCAALALALFALLADTTGAHAQPCPGITYINLTGFTVTLCLWVPPGVPCVTIPPGGRVAQGFPMVMPVNGAFGASGTAYPWQPNPTPPPPSWIPSIQLATAPGPNNCYDLYFDPAFCTVTITLAGPPPCLNP